MIHLYITNLDFNTYDLSKRLQIRDKVVVIVLFANESKKKKNHASISYVQWSLYFVTYGRNGYGPKNEYMYINRLYDNWICPQIVTIFYPYEVMRLVSKHDNPIANNAYRTLSHSVLKIEHFSTI